MPRPPKPFVTYVLPLAVTPSPEKPVTTLAVGEEGGTVTTLALGEEGGSRPPAPRPDPKEGDSGPRR